MNDVTYHKLNVNIIYICISNRINKDYMGQHSQAPPIYGRVSKRQAISICFLLTPSLCFQMRQKGCR